MLFEFIIENIEKMPIPIEKFWNDTKHVNISIIAIGP
jgi:hypothetical protein